MLKLVNFIGYNRLLRLELKQLVRYSCNFMANNDDNKLDTFRHVCDEIAAEPSYLNKVTILQRFFKNGNSGNGFKGDILLWVQFLVPSANQRVYNLQNKAMLKLFARIFNADQQQMQLDLEQAGDVSETLQKYFEAAKKFKPQAKSQLYLQQVEEYLLKLEQRTKEDEQTELLREFCKHATALDLRTFIRLIKQDLRINARARHILDAFGPLAYPAYQSSRDLDAVVKQFALKPANLIVAQPTSKGNAKKPKTQSTGVQVMTPISPMLAKPCSSVDDAFKKNPDGLYSEIKYDGERVQIHKQGTEYKFFSRNLKPVMDHKTKQLKDFIPQAFPGAGDLILDSEILMVDTTTGALLPFGTLGAHKKQTFSNAAVCLFVFDCLLYDGKNLMQLDFCARRKILEQNIKPIKSHVQLSESHFLRTKKELSMMTAKVLQANLEGVVLKSPNGTYQPGKRHWLKVKKDYLFGGKMADTADLVVLGAWYGSGKKGGVLSIFLMGCYDTHDHLWKTVTKVHSGLDDATNDEIHANLMKLTQRADADNTPNWLLCKKTLVPDVLATDPEKMPVWEITGAEFTKSEAHTAAGISIRFPRITRLRSDKTPKEANDVAHLEHLYAASKSNVNVDLLLANCDDENAVLSTKLSAEKTPTKAKNSKTVASSSKRLKREKKESDDEEPASSSRRKTPKMEVLTPPQGEIKQYFKPQATKTNAKAKESSLFDGLEAHFTANAAQPEHMDAFVRHGGTLSVKPQKAALVFYDGNTLENLNELRSLHSRRCRHLNVRWLHASLEAQSCQPYPLYALMLKS